MGLALPGFLSVRRSDIQSDRAAPDQTIAGCSLSFLLSVGELFAQGDFLEFADGGARDGVEKNEGVGKLPLAKKTRRNSRDHGHPYVGCDVIVCWRPQVARLPSLNRNP